MTPERWLQVKDVIQAVLEQPLSDRAAYLDKSCGTDGELLSEVESLLAFERSVEKDIFENNHLPCVFSEETKAQSSGFIGKQIGKYRIERELGAGGMGVVFLAERADGDFEQKVAIKFLRHFSSTSAFQRFLLERKILARLHHPFIAQLFDGGTTSEGTPYLVMEYVEGKAITRFADERNLNLEERLELFCKVCSTVSFAHQNLIVHRDLKPDNILITEEGIPKLLDFGIAKLLSETEVKATVTEQQAFTPEYASPEQIKGETITTASDVYVLGIILYELLSGNRPFQYLDTDNHKEIWHVVNRSEPTKPSNAANQFKIQDSRFKIQDSGFRIQDSGFRIQDSKSGSGEQNPKSKIQNPKSLKGDLDNIVLKALKREPERRYKSVEQMTEDLRRYRQGLPIKARPDTFFYRAGKFINRRRWAIIAACLIVLSLLIGMVTTIQQSSRAERERLRAEQRAESLRKISKSVVFDVHDAIRNLSGSLPARKILLERAVEQLQLLAHDAEADPDLQDELAQAYFSVGEMQQAVGNVSESEESHRRAVAIYQQLTVSNPQNPNYLRGLARGYGFLANTAYLRGESGKSVELYAQVPPIFERLIAENQNDAKNLTDLWNAFSNYAISLIKTGQANEALIVCQKALRVAEQLNKLKNSTPDNRQILYQTKGLIATISGMSGDYQNSIVGFKEVISEAEKLHLEFPEDTRFQYDLWAFYRRIGIAFDKSGNFPESIANLEKSLILIEGLMKSNLKDAGYKRNTSITLLALGQAFSNQRESKKALNVLLRAREISESLFKNDGSNGETIADLALIYGNLGTALARTGKFDESLSNLEKSFDFFNRCLAKSPENNELKQSFTEIVKQTAEIYGLAAKQENSEKAKTFRERANLLLEQSRNIINNQS
jgi:non-specific serine/threonine protein kinase/serine/threonine-protein kinase